jgi:hypothetical protein
MDGVSVQTVTRVRNCLFRSLSILLEDEGRYSRLRQNAIQMFHVSTGQIAHLQITIASQVGSERSIAVLYVFDYHHPSIQWLYSPNRAFASSFEVS